MKPQIKQAVIFLFALLFVLRVSQAEVPESVYISVYALNMRTGPGAEFEKNGTLFLNTQSKVLSAEGGWYEVQVNDSLKGWISKKFTDSQPLAGLEKDKILFNDGDLNNKLKAMERLAAEKQGESFEFLSDFVLNHEKHQFPLDLDKIVLARIFREWAKNGVTDAMNVLLYVLEEGLEGEIGNNPPALAEVRLAAKDAVKILARR